MHKEDVEKIVIPCAGLGVRMLPATKAIPKELLTVVNRPLIHFVASEAAAAGARELIFVCRDARPPLLDYLRRDRELEARLTAMGKTDALRLVREATPEALALHVVVQEKPLGLGHAVLCARDRVEDAPFGIMLPDVLIRPETGGMPRLTSAWRQSGRSVLLVNPVAPAEVQKYGIVDCGGDEADIRPVRPIRAIVEKPPPAQAPSRLAVTGRYVCTPTVFDLLEEVAPDASGEIQLTGAIEGLLDREGADALIHAGKAYDCGNQVGLVRAVIGLALEDPETANAVRLAGREEASSG